MTPPRESSAAHLLVLVRDLCRLRNGPENMPYSPVLFAALVGASVLLDVVTGAWIGGANDAFARSLVSTTLVLALCWAALAIRQMRSRYVQTASALVACSMVFSLLIVPLAWLAGPPAEPQAQLTPLQVLLGWGMLAVLVWNLAVNAHIVRRALDASFALAFALVLAWAIADWALGHVLFDAA